MVESARNVYATTGANAPATTPTQVAVVNDGTGDRQVMIIGDGSSTNLATVASNGALQMQGYQPAAVTFASITATGTQAAQSVAGLNVATLTLRTFTGTTPSVTFRLEASDDNTNWVIIQGINNATGVVGSSWTQPAALAGGTAGPSLDYTIGAYSFVRINVTAISGTSATAAFGLAFQTMPYESSPGAIAQGPAAAGAAVAGNPVLVGGSDGANAQQIGVINPGTANSSGVGQLVGGTSYTQNFSFASVTAGTTYDVGNFAYVAVQVTGLYTGTTPTLTFQCSNDGTNWYSSAILGSASTSSTAVSSTTVAGLFYGALMGRYFRLNQTGTFTSGSTTGVLTFSTIPRTPSSTGIGAPTIRVTGTTSAGLITYSGSIGATATAVKATAGQIYSMYIGNSNTSGIYVQFFALAVGSVTLGTTSPTWSLYVPPTSTVTTDSDIGIAFATAITTAVTTTRAGLTAPANTVDLNIFYN